MKLIETPLHHKIAKEFFLDFTNTTVISKKIYPSLKSKNAGVVSGCLSKWKKNGYIKEGRIVKEKINKKTGKKYTQAIGAFKLNMNPYFDYAKNKLKISPKQKLSKVEWLIKLDKNKKSEEHKKWEKSLLKELQEKEFNKIEKEILEYIFSFKEMRKIGCKDTDLFRGITRVLERIFFYQTLFDEKDALYHYFRKGFFVKNKKYIGEINGNKERFIKFNSISRGHFEKLKKKIELITDFSEEKYFRFMANSELRKYQYMESFIPSHYTNNRQLFAINVWNYIYHYNKIPPGIEPT